jgi:hypothetical protein
MQHGVQFLLSRRGILALAAAAGLVLGTGAGVASAQTRSAGTRAASTAVGTWSKAMEVPGTAALNTGGGAGIGSVSCGASGDCLAAGVFSTPGGFEHPFTVTQARGKWGKAQRVLGMGGLDRGNDAGIDSVSCSRPGNCTIGGSYTDKSKHERAWVASQVHGKWSRAHQLPGMAALNKGDRSTLISLSCVSIGNCTADGAYENSKGNTQPFVVSEVKGTWHDVQAVPGVAALATAGTASIAPLSCRSAGNCSAGGTYEDGQFESDAYVVSQVHGTWGQAEPIPGLQALNTGQSVAVASVACGSSGNCLVGGSYIDPQGDRYTFVASQVNGTWATAKQVPGMAAIATRGDGEVDTLACPTAGNCVAGGIAGINNGFDINGGGQPFVATETNGTWGNAEVVPGAARLNSGADGGSTTLSCPRPGDCAVAGYYGVGQAGSKVYNLEVFVDSQSNGKWGRAEEIPGTAALNKTHYSWMGQVSCPVPGHCSAGGSYSDRKEHSQAFITSQT